MSSSNFNPKKDPQSSLHTCPTPCHPPTKIWIVCSFPFCLITSWITDFQVGVSLFASLVSTKRKFRYMQTPRGVLLGILGGGVLPGSPNPDCGLKSLRLALRASSCVGFIEHCPKAWINQNCDRTAFCRVFFSTDDNRKSHDIDFFLKYAIFKELKSPPFW